MLEWTVLVYANGNNELEPEVANLLLSLEGTNFPRTTEVLVQLGRASFGLVKKIRSNLSITDIDGDWTGIRRYRVVHSPKSLVGRSYYSQLVTKIPSTNMADPQVLSDFLHWGVTSWPAKHYMVVVSGHGVGFIGLLADYTKGYPQVLPIPQFAHVLRDLNDKTKQFIDLLVLDACDMDFVEIGYELSQTKPVAKILLVSQGDSPLPGLPIARMLAALDNPSKPYDSVIQSINEYAALAVQLNHAKFCQASQILKPLTSSLQQDRCLPSTEVLSRLVKKAKSWSKKVVLAHTKAVTEPTLKVWIPRDYAQYERYRLWYDRLQINSPDSDHQDNLHLLPLPLLLGSLHAYNPQLTDSEVEQVASSLGWLNE